MEANPVTVELGVHILMLEPLLMMHFMAQLLLLHLGLLIQIQLDHTQLHTQLLIKMVTLLQLQELLMLLIQQHPVVTVTGDNPATVELGDDLYRCWCNCN